MTQPCAVRVEHRGDVASGGMTLLSRLADLRERRDVAMLVVPPNRLTGLDQRLTVTEALDDAAETEQGSR